MTDLDDLKKTLRKTLDCCQIGIEPHYLQNGKDFYKFLFGNYPELRGYFKGAENFTPEDVQASNRFEKLGQRILLAIHVTVNSVNDPVTFNGYVRETINRHCHFRMDPVLWAAFFAVFVGYLETKRRLTENEKAAWKKVGELFNTEAMKHLANLGLPH